jgi:hypothetical protein
MLTIFGDLIGQTIEAYVDDVVVKSKQDDNLVADLNQAFKCLWAKNIKLNPKNASLGFRGECYLALSSLSAASKPT